MMASGGGHTATGLRDGFENVVWDSCTFHLPDKARVSDGSSAADKDLFWRETVNGVDEASARSLTKYNVFRSRFAHDSLDTEVSESFRRLYDSSQGFHAPVRLEDPVVFTFTDIQLRNRNGAELQMNLGVQLAAPTRLAARYLTFKVTAHPANAYGGRAEDATAAGLTPESWPNIGVELPTEVNAAGNTTLHQGLDTVHLTTPTVALTIIRNILGAAPPIGQVTRPTGALSAEVDAGKFKESFMSFFHECRYRVLKILMRREFVGPFATDRTAIITELGKIRQFYYDPKTRATRMRSVDEYYQAFNHRLSLQPRGPGYTFDPVDFFWANLDPEIKNAAVAEQYQCPPQPLGETQEASLERLRQVKDRAVGFAMRNKQMANVATRARSTGFRGASRVQAFTAQAFVPGLPANWLSPPMERSEARGAAEVEAFYAETEAGDVCGAEPIPQAVLSIDEMYEQAEQAAAVMMSVCEDSMRRATGMDTPPTECWGCTNHPNPEMHRNRFHRYSDCPHKADPIVRANKAKALQDFLAKRQQQRTGQTPPGASIQTATVKDWEAQGYPSQRTAALITTISNPMTNTAVRKSLIKDLFHTRDQQVPTYAAALKTDEQPPPKRPKSDGDDKPPICFFLVPVFSAIRCMEAIKRQFQATLGVTQSMPHVRFPVGLRREALVEVMVDSCAGLNLGRLTYHESIYKSHPEIVSQFAYIKDLENVEHFGVGGVDREAPGLKVEALITYKTPYRISGAPVLITFALSEGAASNTILGLPFLRGTRAALFLDSAGQDTLVVAKFGTTFRVEYHPPLVGTTAPQADKTSQASFDFGPIGHALEALRGTIAQSFQTAPEMMDTKGEDGFAAQPQGGEDALPIPACPVFVPASVFEDPDTPWHE